MSDNPWIKFYASDWLAGTSGLTAAERGVYITLLALMYETGGPIQNDRARLARRCGVPAGSFKRILEGLIQEKKIIETPDGLTNNRAERELGERENMRTKHQSGAQKTNAIKAEKSKQKQGGDERSASRSADAYQKPEPESESKREAKASPARRPRPERFQEFWDQFPHRGGAKKDRAKSEPLYAKAVASGVPEAELIAAAIRYAGDAQVLRGYGKGPEPWLRNKCWQDEIEQPQLKSIPGGRYGERPDHYDRQPSNGPQDRPDPALANIARLAGLGTSSGNGGR